jgi:hypothetical protein
MGRSEASLDSSFLREHGIDATPEAFLRIVHRVVESLPRVSYVDPHGELTAQEIRVLEDAGVDLAPENLGENDPVAKTAAELATMVEAGLTIAQTAKLLGVHESRIRQRLGARTLYGFRWDKRWRIPPWQFEGGECVPHLAEVIQALPEHLHPTSIQFWFTHPTIDLESDDLERAVSPREWLLLGKTAEPVVHFARHLR